MALVVAGEPRADPVAAASWPGLSCAAERTRTTLRALVGPLLAVAPPRP